MNSKTQSTVIEVNDELYDQFIRFLRDNPNQVFRTTPQHCVFSRFLTHLIGAECVETDFAELNNLRLSDKWGNTFILQFDPATFPYVNNLLSLVGFLILHDYDLTTDDMPYTARQLLDLLPPTLHELPPKMHVYEAMAKEIKEKEDEDV